MISGKVYLDGIPVAFAYVMYNDCIVITDLDGEFEIDCGYIDEEAFLCKENSIYRISLKPIHDNRIYLKKGLPLIRRTRQDNLWAFKQIISILNNSNQVNEKQLNLLRRSFIVHLHSFPLKIDFEINICTLKLLVDLFLYSGQINFDVKTIDAFVNTVVINKVWENAIDDTERFGILIDLYRVCIKYQLFIASKNVRKIILNSIRNKAEESIYRFMLEKQFVVDIRFVIENDRKNILRIIDIFGDKYNNEIIKVVRLDILDIISLLIERNVETSYILAKQIHHLGLIELNNFKLYQKWVDICFRMVYMLSKVGKKIQIDDVISWVNDEGYALIVKSAFANSVTGPDRENFIDLILRKSVLYSLNHKMIVASESHRSGELQKISRMLVMGNILGNISEAYKIMNIIIRDKPNELAILIAYYILRKKTNSYSPRCSAVISNFNIEYSINVIRNSDKYKLEFLCEFLYAGYEDKYNYYIS